MKTSRILTIGIALLSIWALTALGIPAVRLTQEVRGLALVILPAAIVTALLVLYFDWRAKLQRRMLGERNGGHDFEKAGC